MINKELTDNDIRNAVDKLSKNNPSKRFLTIKVDSNGQQWIKRFDNVEDEAKTRWRKCETDRVNV
jgi:hypothetical protein